MSLWAVLAIVAILIAWAPYAFAADQPASTPAASSKESLIDTFIAGTDQTSGVAVAVSADGAVQLRNNYGYEAGPDSAEVGERTAFEWGRTSDLLVWAAVMQLVEAGQLNLNTNLSAYLRRIAIDGMIVRLELPELKEMVSLLRYASNNINQIARRMNESGRIYDTDLEQVVQNQEQLWDMANGILTRLATIK